MNKLDQISTNFVESNSDHAEKLKSQQNQIVVWNGKDCSVLDLIGKEKPLQIILTRAGERLFRVFDPLESPSIPFPITIKDRTLKIEKLPPELQLLIGSFLSAKDVANLSQINQHFYSMRKLFLTKLISPTLRDILKIENGLNDLIDLVTLGIIHNKYDLKFIENFLNIPLKKYSHKTKYPIFEQRIIDLIQKYSPYINKINFYTDFFREDMDCGKSSTMPDRLLETLGINCPHLRKISLYNFNGFANESLMNFIENCPKLSSFTLENVFENVGEIDIDKIIIKLSQHCKDLQFINIDGVGSFTDQSLRALAECPKLKNMRVLPAENITDSGVIALVDGCKELESISLNECSQITNNAIKYLAKQCEKLKCMWISGARAVTDVAIKAVARNCKKLSEIGVRECGNVTCESHLALAEYCKELRSVFSDNVITDEALIAYATGCKDLDLVDIIGIATISNETLEFLRTNCPNLKIICDES